MVALGPSFWKAMSRLSLPLIFLADTGMVLFFLCLLGLLGWVGY